MLRHNHAIYNGRYKGCRLLINITERTVVRRRFFVWFSASESLFGNGSMVHPMGGNYGPASSMRRAILRQPFSQAMANGVPPDVAAFWIVHV